jgi:hypothetical protein
MAKVDRIFLLNINMYHLSRKVTILPLALKPDICQDSVNTSSIAAIWFITKAIKQ